MGMGMCVGASEVAGKSRDGGGGGGPEVSI